MQLIATTSTFPIPTTSGTGTPISTAYDGNDWSRTAFLEVTGPATSGDPIPFAFASKEAAIAAAASLSHGIQPALAVLFDATSGPRGSTPWVVQALQMASPSETGFWSRANEWIATGWHVHTGALDLEQGGLSSSLRKFVERAPFAAGVAAIVDGTVTIPATHAPS
jgi:hypothetical protein